MSSPNTAAPKAAKKRAPARRKTAPKDVTNADILSAIQGIDSKVVEAVRTIDLPATWSAQIEDVAAKAPADRSDEEKEMLDAVCDGVFRAQYPDATFLQRGFHSLSKMVNRYKVGRWAVSIGGAAGTIYVANGTVRGVIKLTKSGYKFIRGDMGGALEDGIDAVDSFSS